MNCMVLGGGGFIGSYLVEALVNDNNEVYVYESDSFDLSQFELIKNKVKIVRGNYTTEHNFIKLLDGMDVVYHLISTTVPKTSNDNIFLDFENNIGSTLKLLDACIQCGVKKFIFFSSGGTVYGNTTCIKIDEDHPTNPISAYGVHKLTIEKYIQLYNHLHNLDYRILRISNPYGVRQEPFRGQGVISTFLASAIIGKPLEVWGTGNIIRDYIYIDDVIKGITAAVNYTGEYKIFNIGSGEGQSVLSIIDTISEVIGKRPPVMYLGRQLQDVSANVLDVSRIFNLTAWKSETSLKSGMAYMQKNWIEKGLFKDNSYGGVSW